MAVGPVEYGDGRAEFQKRKRVHISEPTGRLAEAGLFVIGTRRG
jgi:hypothetical protein